MKQMGLRLWLLNYLQDNLSGNVQLKTFKVGMYQATNAQSHLSLTSQEHSRQPLSMVTFTGWHCSLQVGTLHVGQQTPSRVCLRYSRQLSMLGQVILKHLRVPLPCGRGRGKGGRSRGAEERARDY